MLSICIPVYNFDARPVVRELLRQAEQLSIDVEILVHDDASGHLCQERNRELRDLPNVCYTEQPVNLGRARIRNALAAAATGETLIMIDVDCVPNPNYLLNYQGHPDALVVVGGTSYADNPPTDPALRLHWHYGRRRESLAPAHRQPRPYLHFQSNNFRVNRRFFLDHPFKEVKGQGHEDTLWGQLLAPAGTNIEYIDNPVTHLGLETAERFLVKQRQAVETLKQLRREHPTLSTKLTKFADRHPKTVQIAEVFPERLLIRYLLRTHNLRALDLLKLKWWITGWALAIGYP